MKITYFAVQHLKVGTTMRAPGDLVPEAEGFPMINGYLSEGKLAAVLVSSLSPEDQKAIADYEVDRDKARAERLAELDAAKAPAPAVVEVQDDPVDESVEVDSYNEFTVEELKAELEARGVEHAPNAKKATLVELLEADDASDDTE